MERVGKTLHCSAERGSQTLYCRNRRIVLTTG